MKKLLLTMGVAIMLVPNTSNAQAHEQGTAIISVGVGYSLIGGLFNSVYNSTLYTNNFKNTSIPVIVGRFDYGVGDGFSLGLSVAYQSLGFKWDDDYMTSSSTIETGEYKINFSCLSIGVRPLFHFGNNDDMDIYAGLRVGYTSWSTKASSPDDELMEYTWGTVSLGSFGVTPLFGIGYYFSDNFGIHMEVGFGTYIAEGGISLKF